MTKMAVGIPTDILAERIWSCLHEDFDLGMVFGTAKEALQRGDVAAFRNSLDREMGWTSPDRFKKIMQMQNLLKKYKFTNDVFTSEELEHVTNQKYLGNQLRLAKQRFNTRSLSTSRVLREARLICKQILGIYDPEEMLILAKFGKKSSIGCPLRLAYIDHKLTDVRAFTGSAECSKWFFDNVLPKDPILNRMVKRLRIKPGHKNFEHDHLVLENVPKTWKVHRGITPLTLIDLFYTYGVGRVIQRRLKENGLDIRFLQDSHRHLIKRFSKTRRHVTADLSAASDSITSDLLNQLLPRSWFNLIRRSTTHQVMIGDNRFYTESILPMGNGLTFPVETLVFYSLTKAIGNLAGIKGTYSVFGDDLIYPRQIHKYVAKVFPQLGICLNMDKTFVNYPFRESCGEDFFLGIPVRSFYLKNEESTTLCNRRLEAFIYKIINGLRRRWDEHEIPRTLNYLLQLLSCTTFEVLRVPPAFPDQSGIQVSNPNHRVLGNVFVPYAPIHINFVYGSRWFRFRYLRAIAKKRFIVTQEPYYWLSLRDENDDTEITPFLKLKHGNYYVESTRPGVQWEKTKRVRLCRIRGHRRKIVKIIHKPFVASRVAERYVLQQNTRQSCSDWI